MRKRLLAALVTTAAIMALATSMPAAATTGVIVELASPEPVVVARWNAEKAGAAFDESAHRVAIRASQDAFLQALTVSGVAHTVTSSQLRTHAGFVSLDNRYEDLINAVSLEVGGADVIAIRRMPDVKHVTLDQPRFISLDKSVGYIRANGDGSARTAGYRGTGTPQPDGTATGQVIAYLDTGIDHTHPMFDSRFSDADFESRSGDTRLPRLGGEAYVPGEHHPKVIYRADFSGQPVLGDDNGHGTQGGTTAAGLKALAPTGEIVEGVAPGALIMDYKVCPSLTCDGNLVLQSLADSIKPTDISGNPKPRATVVNMSLGSCDGDPYSADAVAAGNLQFAGVISMAAAGNLDALRETLCDDHIENTLDAPGAGRRVMAIGASLDPGNAANNLEVLAPDQDLHDSPLPASDPASLPAEPGQPLMQALHASESRPLLEPLAQHYVDVGFADTPDDVPVSVAGRICLSERGGDVDAGAAGSGLFGNKATQCEARGGVALVIYNNVPGPVGAVLAPAAIPVLTISREDGLHLRDTLGFESGDFGALSRFPLRINLENPEAFDPDTAGFSARGPNNDFRVVKPDLLAPGVEIFMGTALAAGEPTRYTSASGTSFATPHAAGAAALVRDPDFGRPDFTPAQVRAALMNSATNLREKNGAPVPDGDDRIFLHEVGAGLADMVRATSVGTVMGTNELNGQGGPDDTTHPDFLPSYSFGELALIGTGLSPAEPDQQRTVTVTVADVGGGGGTFDLSLLDASDFRGNITRPVDTPGFAVSLSATSVTVPPGGTGTFDVSVAVDGRPGGLELAGTDEDGLEGTDIAWYVIASTPGEDLRMPFAFRGAPGTGNQPPVARDDAAVTTRNQPVTVAVLANDSDPEGDPMTVTGASDPASGSASVNPDETVTYTPDAGFVGTDSFTYTVSDGNAQSQATVSIQVFECPPSSDGVFFDDFEPGPEPGWTVDTAVNDSATSITWTPVADPAAASPATSFFSDAASPVGHKDDRLVAPPQDLTASSRLVFWHRYSFEVDFDGGVLEVSGDGGATWQDVIAGGGSFLEGPYTGTITDIGERSAWTGGNGALMTRVEVDLAAFAGIDVLVRWRLVQDPLFGEAGWWIDDVEFTGLLQSSGSSCNLPPEAGDDHAVTDRDTPVTIDVLANDSDPENDPLTVDSVTQPASGSAQVNPDNTVTYTPDPGFTGQDSFTYTVSDGGGTDTGTVTVDVRQPMGDGKVTGGGWIPDGVEKASFGFNARRDGASARGSLQYSARGSGINLHGDVNDAGFGDQEADFAGTCDLDGTACTFEVHVEDAAEPGTGVDRFAIRVFVGGSLVHEADSLLGGGNIQVHKAKTDDDSN